MDKEEQRSQLGFGDDPEAADIHARFQHVILKAEDIGFARLKKKLLARVGLKLWLKKMELWLDKTRDLSYKESTREAQREVLREELVRFLMEGVARKDAERYVDEILEKE